MGRALFDLVARPFRLEVRALWAKLEGELKLWCNFLKRIGLCSTTSDQICGTIVFVHEKDRRKTFHSLKRVPLSYGFVEAYVPGRGDGSCGYDEIL